MRDDASERATGICEQNAEEWRGQLARVAKCVSHARITMLSHVWVTRQVSLAFVLPGVQSHRVPPVIIVPPWCSLLQTPTLLWGTPSNRHSRETTPVHALPTAMPSSPKPPGPLTCVPALAPQHPRQLHRQGAQLVQDLLLGKVLPVQRLLPCGQRGRQSPIILKISGSENVSCPPPHTGPPPASSGSCGRCTRRDTATALKMAASRLWVLAAQTNNGS